MPRWLRCPGVIALLAVLPLGLAACAPPGLPPSENTPEPTEALRPVEQRGEVPEDARIADYTITARLDAQAHVIEGHVALHWRNRTKRSADRLPFHLYMNAFRASDTAWMSEARGRHRGQRLEEGAWGYIDVHAVRRRAGTGGALIDAAAEGSGESLSFSEDADPTTMTVLLGQPVAPGGEIELDVDFTTKLPRVFARTGYHEDFHMVAQWFPKLGVFEEAEGWKAHTFTLNDEFYADFGNYDVRLDVPGNMVVGATGILVEELPGEPGRKILHYRAEMVHDFAWTADPKFLEHRSEHDGIRIRQLIQPEYAGDALVHLDAQRKALDSMQARYGPYPWSTITIVHVPEAAGGAGGMEYPTLYTTSDIAHTGLPAWVLEERVSGVFTTVHEFGHQYFQGLFASNESQVPWLDEGMNSYSNQQVYVDAYGRDPWWARLLGHEFTGEDAMRLSIINAGRIDAVDQPAHRFRELTGTYGAIVYQKTSAIMWTLRHLVGAEAFDAAIAEYCRRARFRHPTGALFEATMIEALGGRIELAPGDAQAGLSPVFLDVREFFDQALRTTEEVDFTLASVVVRPRVGTAGWHRDAAADAAAGLANLVETPLGDREKANLRKLQDDDVESVVVVRRRGGMRIPVEILVEFEDGDPELVVWDGRAPYTFLTFPGRRARVARIDPTRKLVLETRRLDNAKAASRAEAPPSDALAPTLAHVADGTSLAFAGALGP